MSTTERRIPLLRGTTNTGSAAIKHNHDASIIPEALRRDERFRKNHENLGSVIRQIIADGTLPEDSIKGANILDFGGWNGSLSLILLELGAASVTVLDPELMSDFIDENFGHIHNLKTFKGTIQEFAQHRASIGEAAPPFDLVIAFSVTEHVLDLPNALYHIRAMIRPGGLFFTSHDNYYQPAGAHDNFIITYGPEGAGYYGPKCWDMDEKCATSESFRSQLALSGPWAWGEQDERSKSPEDCTSCPLYKRARPWAHLIYESEFRNVFKNNFFSTGRQGSGLNKVTPFQLRQFTIEAGFEIEVFKRLSVPNEPPQELLNAPYWHNENDLRTLCVHMRARNLLSAQSDPYDLRPPCIGNHKLHRVLGRLLAYIKNRRGADR